MGFITRGRGVTVHHVNCAHILSCDPQRLVQVDWDSHVDTKRRVNLKVHSQDQIGLLGDVTNQIALQGANIKSANISTTKFGKAVISFEVEVKDSKQLNSIVRAIERVRGVIRVERVKQINKTVDIDV